MIAQHGVTQRAGIRLDRPDGFRGKRCNQSRIGAEITGPSRQLPGQQPARLHAEPFASLEAALDLVAERALQGHDRERHPQPRR